VTPVKHVLVANRGEIALRVVRTCRELGIAVSVAHSTADADSAPVRLADNAFCVGPEPSRRSYLNMAAMIEAARAVGADAIHPGYGFLSENADFAEVCATEGITFVGPPAEVIRALGDKSSARAIMAEAGLPLLPGTVEPIAQVCQARAIADDIGYPVIIKAVAGGGGRGMRIVHANAEFDEAFQETTATAKAVFGDGRVYLERYLPSARHVEVQILADAHGQVVHLGARDCSVQRRHQKLIEETPAPDLPAELVDRICAAAVSGAQAAGYQGAGTFEFLVDPGSADSGRFYFMEVNCRIQVEHPVTEMVTGIDLVAEQLRVAGGEALGLVQADITPRGVAIECRVNVEDPDRGWLPTPGRLEEFAPPAGPFVRVDTHGYPGYRIPAAYDSMLAKVVVWAPDRAGALARMRRALAEFEISGPGIRTTIPFLLQVIGHPEFVAVAHDTRFADVLLAARGETVRCTV
jgi:acetyl-CoA carboxylase, biotin carboxylase subunit